MVDKTPIPAAAAVLWRAAGGGGVEVYLAQRAADAAFLGGFWAFPGGAVEARDHDGAGGEGEVELVARAAACARELREETGIEVGGRPRRVEAAGRWVTPGFSPRRFDAVYFLIEASDLTPDHRHSQGELMAGAWIAPADALARWSDGRWLIPAPVVRVLRSLAQGIEGAAARCEAEAAAEARSPRVWELAPGVGMSPLRTPTLPPATHTNCYLLGAGETVVIDPATPYDGERAALVAAIDAWCAAGRRIVEIWLTHHHPDHVGAARFLAERLGVGIAAHAETARLVAPAIPVARALRDGDRRELAGTPRRSIRAVFTPGHAPGHLCFLEETTGMLVAGDMVASIGTVVIDPDEGDMRDYLASLVRMRGLGASALLPAHGGPIVDVAGKIDGYVAHRLWRERRVVEELTARGSATARELVAPVYVDVPAALHGLAERSLLAHLRKLADDGRVRVDGDRWML
jgi:glyoxylase-like metal-dependent hydrolase (beta-lactamase superfamily II)/8-oxo-dGTP pyrophosphatase MutT (NUDIX family)